MNNMRNKILSLLVLLLTAASGAWADESSETFATNKGQLEYTGQHVKVTATHLYDSGVIKLYRQGQQATIETLNGETINSIVVTASVNTQNCKDVKTTAGNVQGGNPTTTITGINATSVILSSQYYVGISEITVYYTSSDAIEVTPGSSANTWTFSMPGSNVVLTPQYAPAAKWDVVETVEQKPAALEGIIAGQDAAIVTAGQSAQGTVMYAVTTTAEAAPALTAFSATVPTAKTYDDATTLYVWYYIQGHDTPDGQQATEENTFNDSEISATPLKVDILTNKFDLTLSPAPVKNMTVTVAGQAKTPTDEGKVTGVKMESEVKLKAADGYKFRKVEVKKKGAPKYADVVTICEKNGDYYLISSFFDGTNANITTITKEEAIALAEYLGGGDIRVVYEEYEFSGTRYVRATKAAGNVSGIKLSTTNASITPLYYVPAGN